MSRLDDAIELLDLEDWISAYCTYKKVDNDELKIQECPKCGNEKYKLYLNTDFKKWNCFRCGWGKGLADITLFMADISGRNLLEIRKELINTYIPSKSTTEFVDKITSLLDFNYEKKTNLIGNVERIVVPGYDNFDSEIGSDVKEYLYARGVSSLRINEYRIKASYKLNNIVGPYAVFPVSWKGTDVAWQGRAIHNNGLRYVSSDNIGQWLWSPNTNFGENKTPIILVEGIFDAIGVDSVYYANVACTFGKKITKNQVNLLKSIGFETIYLCWDPDALKEIESAAIRLGTIFNVKVINLKHGLEDGIKRDPGDILQNPNYADWFDKAFENAVDVQSEQFFEWRVKRALDDL